MQIYAQNTTRIHLENRKSNHSKFYEVWGGIYRNITTKEITEAFVGMCYGRIGSKGRTLFQTFLGHYCHADALDFLGKKVEEKLARGYEIISELDNGKT